MEHEVIVRKNTGSLQITIPAALTRWIGLEDGDTLIVKDEEGKHGKFFSTWKKK